MKILLDTNVIVDVLQKREPWWKDGARIINTAAANRISACITTKQLADIHYFSKQQFKGQENIDAKARQVTSRLLSLILLIDTTVSDCRSAFGINNGDYEDAMVIASASRESVDYIITRNPVHFHNSIIPVLSPAEFVKVLNREFENNTDV